MLGIAALGLLYFNQQICGVSGMVEGCLPPFEEGLEWKSSFLLGLVIGGLVLTDQYPLAFDFTLPFSLWHLFIGGVLVGIGSRLGRGCTSGHGICGMARLAPRSILAVLIFLGTAMATATLIGAYR